ncbi:hypothetical protein Leryth_004349 [Lithospermum erythrorhizon]|nr:hypothetical protein Leryth_004349 [Lithospermum erythrorhizon]
MEAPVMKLSILAMVVLVIAAMEFEPTNGFGEPICGMSVSELLACEPAVVKPPSKPSPSCCKAIQKANLPCLCKFKGADNPLGIPIDPALAMQLPTTCGVVPSFTC